MVVMSGKEGTKGITVLVSFPSWCRHGIAGLHQSVSQQRPGVGFQDLGLEWECKP